MVDVRSKKCPCGIVSSFALIGSKPSHCAKCKTEGMVDVRSRKCLAPLCDIIAQTPKYKSYCSRCYFFTFPGAVRTRNYKTKESLVESFIKENFKQFDLSFDRTIKTITKEGCSLRKPDCYIDFGNYSLIIEIDEDKHSGYSCENKRIMELFQDLGFRPLIIVRFNPDAYIEKKTNKRILSCFTMNKETGILNIASKPIWNQRLAILKRTIEEHSMLQNIKKEITTVQLFYE